MSNPFYPYYSNAWAGRGTSNFPSSQNPDDSPRDSQQWRGIAANPPRCNACYQQLSVRDGGGDVLLYECADCGSEAGSLQSYQDPLHESEYRYSDTRYTLSSFEDPSPSSLYALPSGLRAVFDPSQPTAATYDSTGAYNPMINHSVSQATALVDSVQIVPQGTHSSDETSQPDPAISKFVHCRVVGCNSGPFKRSADLRRHHNHVHAPASDRDTYSCDYKKCSRRTDPFHRRDHFRDHLREYHREDIQKRGDSTSKTWFEGRQVSADWWRCSRCLVRVEVSTHGFRCPDCKTDCEPNRKERRRAVSKHKEPEMGLGFRLSQGLEPRRDQGSASLLVGAL